MSVETEKRKDKNKASSLILGSMFIFLGVLLNQWVVEYLFVQDGTIESVFHKFLIWLFNITLIVIGIIIIKTKAVSSDWKTIKQLAVLTFVCFILLEIGFRIYLNYLAPKEVLLNYGTYNMIQKHNLRWAKHPYLIWYPNPNYKNEHGDKHNSLGYRGEEITSPKPNGVYRIVCIGGSTTYTTTVDHYTKSYPYRLEKELHKLGHNDVEVINGGVANYDTFQSLINLGFRVLDLDPDMVIVYHGVNEIQTRFIYPPESYRGDNTGRFTPRVPNVNILDHLAVFRVLLVNLGISVRYGTLNTQYSAETYVFDDYFAQLKKKIYPSGVFKQEDIFEILEKNEPHYTRRNIKNMIYTCRNNGITIVLSSFAYVPLNLRNSSEVFGQTIKEYNESVRMISDELQVPFFDFAAVMPQDKLFWTKDGIHINERGAERKAQLFADFINDFLKTL